MSEKTTSNYQQEFRQIAMDMSMVNDFEGWEDLYKRLIFWELELDQLEDEGLNEILLTQKKEANSQFFKFISKNYEDWLHNGEDAPVMSHTLFKKWVNPSIKANDKTCLIVIDNLRYDQWKVIKPIIEQYYITEEEKSFYSILPTATQYARNAIFSGLMPLEIKKRFGDKWVDDNDEKERITTKKIFYSTK